MTRIHALLPLVLLAVEGFEVTGDYEAAGSVKEVAAYGDRLYVSTGEGIEVVDVSGPPRKLGVVPGAAFAAHNGNRLYVANGGGFDTWDTSLSVARSGGYTHMGAAAHEGITVRGVRLFYQPDTANTTLVELDVSDPDLPRHVATYTLPQVPRAFTVAGGLVTAGPSGVFVGSTQISNISTATHVAETTEGGVAVLAGNLFVFSPPELATKQRYEVWGPPQGLAVIDGTAYVTLQAALQEVHFAGSDSSVQLHVLEAPSGSLLVWGSRGCLATNTTHVTLASLPEEGGGALLPTWGVVLLMGGAVLLVGLLSCCLWGAFGSTRRRESSFKKARQTEPTAV